MHDKLPIDDNDRTPERSPAEVSPLLGASEPVSLLKALQIVSARFLVLLH